MKTAAEKAESSESARRPAKYRPTSRARLHNLVWTIMILISWPFASILALIERRWTHE